MKKNEKKESKPRFKTNYNNYKSESDFEKLEKGSLTLQDESYSLREIIEKFSREYPKHLLRTGYSDEVNFDEPDWDDIDPTRQPDFDLTDAIELREKLREKSRKKEVKRQILEPKQEPENESLTNPSET